MSAIPQKADIAERRLDVRFVPIADILHCSNNAGLLGQVLPNFRQQFSFDTYFFPPTSGKIHMATILKAAVASTKSPNSGCPAGNDSKALFHRHAGGRDSGRNVRRRWPWA
jgi:hypothetical protein